MNPAHGVAVSHHPFNFQNTNGPDVDPDNVASVVGGGVVEELAGRSEKKGLTVKINFSTVIISAIVFLAILAWFDFMQTAFYGIIEPVAIEGEPSPGAKLWYAMLITGVVVVMCIIILINIGTIRL